jgi:hypothetical protein
MKYLDALVAVLHRARPDVMRLVFFFSGTLLLDELAVLLLLPTAWVRAAGSLTVLLPALFTANALFLALRYRRGRRAFYLHRADLPAANGWHVAGYFVLSLLLLAAGAGPRWLAECLATRSQP